MTDGMTESPNVVSAQPKGSAIIKSMNSIFIIKGDSSMLGRIIKSQFKDNVLNSGIINDEENTCRTQLLSELTSFPKPSKFSIMIT
jgi:hypothetical protein